MNLKKGGARYSLTNDYVNIIKEIKTCCFIDFYIDHTQALAVGFRLGRNTTIVITVKHNIITMHSWRVSHNTAYDTVQSRSRQ